MDDSKARFGKVLEIIGYTGNRDELFNSIFGLCYFNALVDLIDTLPEDKQGEVKNAIFGAKGEQQAEIVKKYFNGQQFTDAFKKSSEKIFQNYYDSIRPSLSETQIVQLNDYLGSVLPQTA